MARLRVWSSFVAVVLLLAAPAFADPVTLLSAADPGRLSGSAGGLSVPAGISSDGRWTLFLSGASNLLAGIVDTNDGMDVFLYDRLSGMTTLVSHAAGDPTTASNGVVEAAALSTDGRFAAFLSRATNLVSGQVDGAGTADVFLWDRLTGASTLVSHLVAQPVTAAGGCLGKPGLSADGAWIVFTSEAAGLVAGQSETPAVSADVFLYNRAAGSNSLVSHAVGAPAAAAGGSQAVISADGGWIAFLSAATNLVAGQAGPVGVSPHVFLHQRATGTATLVSHAAGTPSTVANRFALSAVISPDGRWVAYLSEATDLVAGQLDTNSLEDAFLYDRMTGASTLVSHTPGAPTVAGNFAARDLGVSADGQLVVFASRASDLVAGDTNQASDVFLHTTATGTNTLISHAVSSSAPAAGDSEVPVFAADASGVVFRSSAYNLVSGQDDVVSVLGYDLFQWTRASDTVTLLTQEDGVPLRATNAPVSDAWVSGDGAWVAFSGTSERLDATVDDANGATDAFLFDRSAGEISLLSARQGVASATAGGAVSATTSASLSNDGRWIAFTSSAPNLMPGLVDLNNAEDVFLYDRMLGTLFPVSHADGLLVTASGASRAPLVSADGGTVVFESYADNLVNQQSASSQLQLFLWSRGSASSVLVSHTAGFPEAGSDFGTLGDGQSAVSSEGRFVAFASSATSMVPGESEGNAGPDIFLFDRMDGSITLVSHASGSPTQTANGFSRYPVLSGDGRWVAYTSTALDLVPSQVGAGGLFLWDRLTGTNLRIARPAGNPLALSADGRYLAFSSSAGNLVPGQVDTNGTSDVFLWDRVAGTFTLASRSSASATTTGNGFSILSSASPGAPALSADGRRLLFLSSATDLVPGQTDTNAALDVFLFDRETASVTLVSRAAGSAVATADRGSSEPALSADGRFAVFRSSAGNFVTGQVDTNGGDDLFLFDRETGAVKLLTHRLDSTVTAGRLPADALHVARLSGDGGWIAFTSPAPDLVAADHDGVADAFLVAGLLPPRDFFTVPSCRLLDTRQPGQGPALVSGTVRTLIGTGACGIPATARALAVNATVVQPTGAGYVTAHPGDGPAPLASLVTFAAGVVRSNNAVLGLAADGSGRLSFTPLVTGAGTVHLVVDVTGYFE